MTDIRKGDLVRVTRKGYHERVAEGRVKSLGVLGDEIVWEPDGRVVNIHDWDVEVLDRPIDEALVDGAVEAFRKAHGYTGTLNNSALASYRRDLAAVVQFILDYQKEHAK